MNQQYVNYSFEDLATDENFISWVLTQSNNDLWQSFINENPSLAPLIAEAKSFVLDIHHDTTSAGINSDHKEKVWSKIDAAINAPSSTPMASSKTKTLALILTAAASLLIVSLLFFNYFESIHDVQSIILNTDKDTKELVLPDESFVYLDNAAQVSFSKDNFLKDRNIKLKGQAFFEVQKGSEFIVSTAKGSVKVLGTSFNVIETPDNLIVACYTGKVMVSYKKEQVVLLPGEQSDFKQNTLKTRFDATKENPDWVIGYITYENKDYSQVLSDFEQHYKVKLNVDSRLVDGKKYSGRFSKSNIDEALQSITWPFHMKYVLEKDQVTLSLEK